MNGKNSRFLAFIDAEKLPTGLFSTVFPLAAQDFKSSAFHPVSRNELLFLS